MTIYPFLTHRVLLPIMDRARGTRVSRRLDELNRSQWLPYERLQEAQLQGLRSLLEYAFTEVPYYRRIAAERGVVASDIHDLEDLRKLPLLTKDIIHDNFQDLVSREYPRESLRPSWTGGTSGQRLHFYTTKDNQLSWAYPRWARSMGMIGRSIGDRHVSVGQMIAQRRTWRQRAFHNLSTSVQRIKRLDALDVTEEKLADVVKAIDAASPCTLAGYPSGLALIAEYIKEHGLRPPEVVASMVGGEQLLPYQRDLIREVFGNEPYNRYGSNELLEAAAECPARTGLHLSIEDFVVEVVDENGRPLPAGEVGLLVFTNLRSYGMPFIRYAIGDIGSVMPEQCSCGRTLPLLHPVVARTIDFLYSRDGRRIAPMQLHLENVMSMGIARFRIVQHDYDHLSVELVPWAGQSQSLDTAAVADATVLALRNHLDERVIVDVGIAERIEMNLSGKRLAIRSEVPRLPAAT